MNSPQPVILCTGKFLALVQEGHWEYAKRVNANGAAIVLAVTNDRKILLVEQYRIPMHARTIELPAGMVGDEPGASLEKHIDAARRELLEETGYAAERFEPFLTGAASSGATSELLTFFRASGLKRVHSGGGIGHEDIVVHDVPLAGIDSWLQAKADAGMLVDPKVYAGLYFAQR